MSRLWCDLIRIDIARVLKGYNASVSASRFGSDNRTPFYELIEVDWRIYASVN